VALVSVAVPVPFLDLLTYHLPDGLPRPARGARVLVPVGARRVTGIVMDDGEPARPASAALKDVIEILDAQAFLPPAVVDLALWVAEYYACGPGDALSAAMPPSNTEKTVQRVVLSAQGHDPGVKLAKRQAEAVEMLRGAPDGLPVSTLAERGISTDVLKRLALKGMLVFQRSRVERDPFSSGVVQATVVRPSNRELTEEQAGAVTALQETAARGTFSVTLLHGVTGSGKTEVYLRVADTVRRAGKSVLVLVPEIALTPALASVFREAFGNDVAVQHSGLSAGERGDQWERIRRGDVSIVVGTRSAVFAPLSNLGLIIVDEEHDTSFKQEETPRYHGRDVAVMRGKQEGAMVVLGSATPSLESAQNATAGRYALVSMKRRVQDRPLPAVSVVDMRLEYAAVGPDVIFSQRLTQALAGRLQAGQQSLVLLNRRGLATAVFCRQCGSTLDCPNCSVSLIVHSDGKDRHRARCHYCNYSALVPKACPSCAGPYLERRGFGTERVEAEIRRLWPRARVARIDRDSIRRRGAVAQVLRSMAAGDLDVLVGTQMIAKGHDFPRVTLVGVISADVGLGVADFRAAERTFQLLTQVAGRAGRGVDKGEAVIQTLFPDHYSIRHACSQDYDAFFADEIAYRRAMRYPPLTALVNLVVRGPDGRRALSDAATLARQLSRTAEAGRYAVLGPAPAPLAKLRGEYRAQLFLKGANRTAMREAVQAAVEQHPDLRRRVAIDIDPVSIL